MSHQESPRFLEDPGGSTAELPLVNSWDEWSPLQEIVVGTAVDACYEPTEPANRPMVRNRPDLPFPTGPKPASLLNEVEAQLDELVELLVREGVTVRRPAAIDFDRPVASPHFAVANQYCAVCPRDVMITIGNEVIEATMSRRGRYFEFEAYRKLVYEYWSADSRMSWTVAPKPSMADRMYQHDFWDRPIDQRYAQMHSYEFCITQDEVVFDAADMCRMGRDVFVQESMTTNRMGIRWLKRHLEPQGIRVHPVHFPLDLFPSHIDCTFVPLRPGLVLTNPDRPMQMDELAFFSKSGWKLVDAPEPVLSNEQMPTYCQSSKWLSMNVLSLSPTKVVCEEQEHPLHELLTGLGLEVLTVPFRKVFEFGGSLHCATWDVRREGGMQDYFTEPDQLGSRSE